MMSTYNVPGPSGNHLSCQTFQDVDDNKEQGGQNSRLSEGRKAILPSVANGRSSEDVVSYALTPEIVLRQYGHRLTNMEQKEILNYPEIYFIGLNAKKRPGVPGAPNNNGYDDDQGSYIHVCHDHISYRYELLKVIGKGSFGQVMKAYDHKTRTYVALKIVRNEKRFHRQAQEEIRILENLKMQDRENKMNIVHMFDHFHFRNHICMTFELLSINLYELIKKNKFQGFTLQLVRKFAHSILLCLDGLYKNSIIHCDLKPENILLKQQGRSGAKVIDFGSSCYEHQRVYTYIQSRFYRAPEVILGSRYSLAIDMWSLGCILAELYTGTPLFAGEDEADQLACIMEVLGMPPRSILDISKRTHQFISSRGFPRYCVVTTRPDGQTQLSGGRSSRGKYRGPPGSKDLARTLKNCDDEPFVDFLRRCFEWDPSKRITPAQALHHSWLRRHSSKSHAIHHNVTPHKPSNGSTARLDNSDGSPLSERKHSSATQSIAKPKLTQVES